MPANINKKELSETDIITKFILPAVKKSGWDNMTQIRQEVRLRDGKVIVRGQMAYRKKNKAADIVLYHKTSMPLAVIEAKANKHEVGKGMQQALDYAALLEVPFAFASNGDSFIFHDKTNKQALEKEIRLEDFPTPEVLWEKYCQWKDYKQEHLPLITQDYYDDGTGKAPRYYQLQAINKTVEAVARGQNRILLVMATGTGKTYTAFNIIWRLWKAKAKKRILFLADRNILVDQTKSNDFQPFGTSMTKITQRTVDPAYEIHLGLYQAMTGTEEKDKAYKQVSPDFFDLIVIDECHRGSAAEDSAWREILAYFSSATQIGLTATPKETKDVSNIDYFGEPIYTYSLKQGIEDGFLAPFKVICVDLDIDSQGWRPQKNQIDNKGNIIEDRVYNQSDMDRTLVVDERTLLVAQTITNYLKTDPMAKTIVFCDDIDHADRMRRALVNLNPEKMAKNDKYVMKITGDDEQGKAQLDNFIDPKKPYPVIVTTSELMTTGVDAKTCKLVVIDQHIKSMTKFKQIIGRGTRINEHYGKLWFTIMDFKKASVLFADSDFDGEPSQASNFNPKAGQAPSAEELAGGKKPNEEEGGTDTEDGNDGTTDSTDEATDEATDEGIITDPDPDDEDDNKIRKFYISDIDVKVIAERVQYYDADGDLVTESFKDYSRKTVAKKFSSLDDFIRKWNEADRKQAIVKELTELGVIWEVLKEEAGREDLDPFDLICHVVYDQPALTRKERADNVKKRNYFTKYGEIAQQVLNSLLEKYADAGVDEIENMAVLKVAPFDKLGRPTEIVKNGFGDKESYLKAVADLELEIYKKQG